MKNIQRKEHEVRTTIKKSAIKILEPNSGHTESEKNSATRTLHEHAKHELIGQIIRSKGDTRNKSKPTPAHFAAATYRRKTSIMTEAIDNNNN